MTGSAYDLAIIGGGINGCGIARDAAGRGLSVYLCDQGDLGGATSSASTKLIHGGLRYLEFYEFRLVREALIEREVLLASAPHIIWPLRFVLPHHRGLRPWPVIRLGLFFYDHLGGRRILPPTRSLDLARDATGKGLKKVYRRAFEYSDCWVEDARLVVLNARDAAERSAHIRTRTRCVAARRGGREWHLTVEDQRDGTRREVVARALVNAAGPWVSQVIAEIAGLNVPARVRLVKGSHIVIDRVFDHDRAYIFQNADGRICFAIPYERDFTLIGTTDEDFEGDPATATISEHETDYLLAAVSEYLERPLTRDRIRWTYAGVRPLYDDGASKAPEATRDFVLGLAAPADLPPLLSVFGGKITTYRRLAEQALQQLAATFPAMRAPWTRAARLPGGDIPVTGFERWAEGVARRYPFLEPALLVRLCRAYGSRVDTLLARVTAPADMGYDFGARLTEREIDYLVANEWAETADDILWRRSKLGLRLRPEQCAEIERYLEVSKARSPLASAGGHG
ncbi:MAG: glycerol-3-phosphate dehydrogenase [Candidatus Eiseniibacteriota bacterium]